MLQAPERPQPSPTETANKSNILQTLKLVEVVESNYHNPNIVNPRTQDMVLDGLLAISKSSYFKTPDAQIVRDHLAQMGQDPRLMLRFVERLESHNGEAEAMRDGLALAQALQVQDNPVFQPLLQEISLALKPKLPLTPPFPTDPPIKQRSRWKGRAVRTAAAGLVATAAVIGHGALTAPTPSGAERNPTPVAAGRSDPSRSTEDHTMQTIVDGQTGQEPQVVPTVTLATPAIKPTQKVETASAAQPTPPPTVEAPKPTPEPPKPTAQPTEAPKRPEANLKGDILKDVIGPKLLQEARQRNAELNAKDPERPSRLNPEINKNRFTMLLLGMGSEKDVQMTDTILMLSYDVKNNKIQVISIPRDTYAPEVDQYKKAHGIGADKFNAINTAFQTGLQGGNDQTGFDLVRRSAEDATGLEVHDTLKVEIEALQYFVDNFTGPVTVDVDIDADLLHAKTGDPNHDGAPVVFHHGVQQLGGEDIQQLARFRADSYVTFREPDSKPGEVGRVDRLQHRIIPAVFKAIVDKFKPKGDNPFQKGLDLVSKAPDAKKLYDVIGEMEHKKLIQADSSIMDQIQDYAGTFVWAAASGANISVDVPPMEMLALDESHGLSSAGEITHEYRPDLRVVESKDIHDPKKADHLEPLNYWDHFRQEVSKFILKS